VRLVWILLCLAPLLAAGAARAQAPAQGAAGQPCTTHSACGLGRCETAPDGGRYCTARDKLCSYPGRAGADLGQRTLFRGACHECRQGLGWRPC
jgi:hypothetical protein